VLRILAGLKEPIAAPELAKRAALQRSSVHRTLRDLETYGIVSFVGVSQRTTVSLRGENPLSRVLRDLFAAEKGIYETLVARLRQVAAALKPPPISVWLEGQLASGRDRPGDPITVGVVASSRDCESTVDALREGSQALSEQLDVAIEFRGFTRADLNALDVEQQHLLFAAIPVAGVPPLGLLERFRALWEVRHILSHSDLDRRSLQYGEQIAEALRKDKSLLDAALDFVTWRLKNASEGEKKELREWQRLLRSRSVPAIRRVLTDSGERATRLRQTNPFVASPQFRPNDQG
jgi:hypothetical protein